MLDRSDIRTVSENLRIAVLIPCFNEEATIAATLASFRSIIPQASLFVCDNNSTDRTVLCAESAGAILSSEEMRGKGNVVRRMFADIEADIYVLVDGDNTYDAAKAPYMIRRLIADNLDMVNGARVTEAKNAYRPGHRFGNIVLSGLVKAIFGNRISDLLSGYRVLSRRFVKSFPALSRGFEIETEISVHALELRMPLTEVDTAYRERPAGSTSKLRTYRDGIKILWTIVALVKEERPLPFFSSVGIALACVSIVMAWPLLETYLETGLVPRLPTAILSTGLVLLAFLCFFLRTCPGHRDEGTG